MSPKAQAEADAQHGQVGTKRDRIAELTAANRVEPDGEREAELVRLRHEAFADLDPGPPVGPWPPSVAPSDGDGPPELRPEELTPQTLRDGIFGHGSVLIRGLVDAASSERLVTGIDRARQAQDAYYDETPTAPPGPYFTRFKPGPGYKLGSFYRKGGSVLTVESPRMLFELLALFERVGLKDLATSHLGERPALSAKKGTLRCASPEGNNGWHQDGAFMGPGIRALNVWLSLSTCGEDAPGLDIVPRRLDELAERGTQGAYFDWTVGPGKADEILGGAPPWRPLCEPGDVMLFDDKCLHRTGLDPGMTRHRYAIETWLFAPSCYPDGQVPLVW